MFPIYIFIIYIIILFSLNVKYNGVVLGFYLNKGVEEFIFYTECMLCVGVCLCGWTKMENDYNLFIFCYFSFFFCEGFYSTNRISGYFLYPVS